MRIPIKDEKDIQMLFNSSEQLSIKSFNDSEQDTEDISNDKEKTSSSNEQLELVRISIPIKGVGSRSIELNNFDELFSLYDVLKKPYRLKIIFFLLAHKISYLQELAKQVDALKSTLCYVLNELEKDEVIVEVAPEDEDYRHIINLFKTEKHNAPLPNMRFYKLSEGFVKRYSGFVNLYVKSKLSPSEINSIIDYKRLPQIRKEKREALEKQREAKKNEHAAIEKKLKEELEDFKNICIKAIQEHNLSFDDSIQMIKNNNARFQGPDKPDFLRDEVKKWLEALSRINERGSFENLKNSWKRDQG